VTQTIKFDSLSSLFNALKEVEKDYQIFCPTKQDGTEVFLPLVEIKEDNLKATYEILSKNEPPLFSIKSFLFPNSEIYLKFKREKDSYEFSVHSQEETPTVVLGGKPCDVESFGMIDMVFLQEPVDTFYQQKRENTILITSVCNQKGPNCLCDEFGVDKCKPKVSDILLVLGEQTTQKDEAVYLEAVSERGENFLEKLDKSTESEGESNTPNLEGEIHQKDVEKLSPEKIKDIMENLYDSPIWAEFAMRCLGCGICTYYCPTCHCYDINDFHRKDKGVRYRSWDSCMFSNFSNMAGGHNPRPSKEDRIKNRFFHKLNYFVKQQGPLACVGCGRCAKNCPAGISIGTVLKKIGVGKHV